MFVWDERVCEKEERVGKIEVSETWNLPKLNVGFSKEGGLTNFWIHLNKLEKKRPTLISFLSSVCRQNFSSGAEQRQQQQIISTQDI